MIRLDLQQSFPSLHLVGRNGMHKYNNQDHAMMTAMLTARNVLAGERIYDIWQVNEDAAYHESGAPGAHAALAASAEASYTYVRQVDAHGHWIGLGMLLILFGAAFHRVNFAERAQLCLAWGLVLGAITFPLGVLLETASGGWFPKAVAVAGSALLIFALAGVALGFARPRP